MQRVGRGGLKIASILRVFGALTLALSIGFAALVWATEVPNELEEEAPGTRKVLDRSGQLIARTQGMAGAWSTPCTRDEIPEVFVRTLLAAEDRRFFRHWGVDPLAMLRALGQALREGRIVSGASTLTQQLARTTLAKESPFLRKVREVALAFQLERSLTKNEILTLYVNRVHFGPQVLGLGAASDRYFNKRPIDLELSEAATLAGLVRGPSLYDLERRPELARRRRDRVLERLERLEPESASVIRAARESPLSLRLTPPLPGARHWIQAVLRRVPSEETILQTTLDLPLQRELERLAKGRRSWLGSFGASALAAIVVDHQSLEILAYLGSSDFEAVGDLGQNDGVQALRQPGSTLKPFLYAQAMDNLGYDASTLLPDEPTHFVSVDRFWAPENFDRTFRGEVSLARALANSLNVPAVHVLHRLGLERGLEVLHAFGFESLDQPAQHYGLALALGDGEVSLFELAAAYAALARGGAYRPLRLLKEQSVGEPVRAVSPQAAAAIGAILADGALRREVFGSRNALEFPFRVAVKTGTSKGYRDAWVVGFSARHTVAVWVGNFDGRPMKLATGAASAGQIFHDIMLRTTELTADGGLPSEQSWEPLEDVRRPPSGPNRFISSEKVAVPRVTFPKSGMRFVARGAGGRRSELRVRVESARPGALLWIDGRSQALLSDGTMLWRVEAGWHEIFAENPGGLRSDRVQIFVEE